MSPLLISVVIPTYHRNDLLAQCLECLAPGAQTLPVDQYEVIVTDDGSESTAEAMIRERYPWARWVEGPRRGPAANRNWGVTQAHGTWIAFTDDDCLPVPAWLQAYAHALQPSVMIYEGKTTCIAGIHSPLEHAPINIDGGYLWSCNMVIHGHLFAELGGFDEDFPYPHMEDVDLRERLKAKEYSFTFISSAVVDHPPRRLPWGTRLGSMFESEMRFRFKHQQRLPPRREVLASICRARIRAIARTSLGVDTLLALTSLVAEIFQVTRSYTLWVQRVPSRCPATTREAE